MSLVFGKIDRKNNTQSIYCDGMTTKGSDVMTRGATKITSFTTSNGYSVCAGFCGIWHLNNYFRLSLQKEFEKTFKQKPTINNLECFLPQLFNSMLEDYMKIFHTPKNAPEQSEYYSALLIINGVFFLIEHFENESFHCALIPDDIFADGQGDTAAKCLLENNVKPKKILKTISKYNLYVSDSLTAIENVSFVPFN